MIRNFLLICLLGCGISLATAGNPPYFTTGTAVNGKGELLMTQRERNGWMFLPLTGKLCSVPIRSKKLLQDFCLMGIWHM